MTDRRYALCIYEKRICTGNIRARMDGSGADYKE
jgi:hypothetical protein